MNRHPQWEERLHAFVTESMGRAHDYEAQWDCLFGLAGGAVKAVTGKDLTRKHRGKYNSHATAYRYLSSLGFDSAEALLDSLFDRKPVGFAHRGDLVLCDVSSIELPGSQGGHVPGVCLGAFALCLSVADGKPGAGDGLVRVPRDQWVKAWAVGEHHSSWPQASEAGEA